MAEPPRAPSVRTRVAAVSRPLLTRLSALPRPLVPLATLALVAVGLFAPLPVALPALAVVLAFVLWLSYLSWPVVPPGQRLIRLVVAGLLAAAVALRL